MDVSNERKLNITGFPTAIRRLHAAIIRKVLAFSDFQLRPDVNLAQVKRTCNWKMATQPQNSFSDLEKPHLNTTAGWEDDSVVSICVDKQENLYSNYSCVKLTEQMSSWGLFRLVAYAEVQLLCLYNGFMRERLTVFWNVTYYVKTSCFPSFRTHLWQA